jgi:heme ABC exporter ATP-binding subunit CcmA
MTALERVRADGVTKIYGRQRALGGATFELSAGRICALLGPNGAGKSTLVSILSTLVRPTAGEVRYGEIPHHEAARALRGAIGLLGHEPFLYGDLSARENLSFFERLYGRSGGGEALLARVGLTEAAGRPVKTYSRGMQQRLALARALIGEPSLLLLDEPFAGLDPAGVEMLRDLLAERARAGAIVLVVTHDLAAVVGLAAHVLVLRRGKVAADEARPEPFARLEEIQRLDPEGARAAVRSAGARAEASRA